MVERSNPISHLYIWHRHFFNSFLFLFFLYLLFIIYFPFSLNHMDISVLQKRKSLETIKQVSKPSLLKNIWVANVSDYVLSKNKVWLWLVFICIPLRYTSIYLLFKYIYIYGDKPSNGWSTMGKAERTQTGQRRETNFKDITCKTAACWSYCPWSMCHLAMYWEFQARLCAPISPATGQWDKRKRKDNFFDKKSLKQCFQQCRYQKHSLLCA